VALVAFPNSTWKSALVLALDVSRSIRIPELDQVKQASAQFLAQLKDPVALITFADTADTPAGFETPRDRLIASISQLKPIGRNTRLYDGVDKALGLLENRPGPERQRIIVISDGDEDSQAGADSLDGVLARAAKRRIPIDTIWVPTAAAGARNTLVRASERTDGFHADAKQAPDILSALKEVQERNNNAVVVSFERKLDSSGMTTKETGIAVDRPGISSASLLLQIPASAPSRSWLDIFGSFVTFLTDLKNILGILGALASTYGAYTAYFLLVRKYYGQLASQKLPFDPIQFRLTRREPDTPPVTPPSDSAKPPAKKEVRRKTMVDHPSEPARDHGLILQVLRGPFEGQSISVDREHFRIGADPDNDLAIATDEFVSGHHATIQSVNGEWLLIDQGSRNGTFIDGQRLGRGPGQILRRGQSIQLGTSEFQVILEDNARAAHASSMPVR
jgi:hypothetical protein